MISTKVNECWWRHSNIFISNDWLKIALLPVVFFCLLAQDVQANNLQITNVSLEDRDQSAETLILEFDISWDNAWRTPVNFDAVWLFVKMQNDLQIPPWGHASLVGTGLDPDGYSAGSNPNMEIYVTSDLLGAFIRFKSSAENPSFQGAAQSSDVRLVVDYGANTQFDYEDIKAQIHGIEMVYIPTGPFFAGDGSGEFTFLATSTTTENVWFISDDGAMQMTAAGGGTCCNYYTADGGGVNEFGTGVTFVVPETFPLGYNAFYAMKYEVTEGQFANFLNTLDATQLPNVNPVGDKGGATLNRNTMSGVSPGVVGTYRPNRSTNYMDWPTAAAYLDWAALRPMTELEFEKMARGPLSIVRDEFAWGSTSHTLDSSFSISPENGREQFASDANVTTPTYTQGDAIYGACCNTGPLRAGIFADGASTRVEAGAGYYGNMDLSGNVWEWAFSVGNSVAISQFAGEHGDGVVSSNGFASFTDAVWGTTSVVTGNDIIGLRGGHWGSPTSELRISDRSFSNENETDGDSVYGFRGVRTADDADDH